MKKFKTTIELVTEAENKNEAMEIVGEYLSGQLASGVDMRCRTRRQPTYNKAVISVVVTMLILTISIFSIAQFKSNKSFVGAIPEINAVQSPLKTSSVVKENDFKKAWEARQTKEALNRIKK